MPINITPTMLRKKIEDLRQLGAFMFPVEPPVREPRVRHQLGAVDLRAGVEPTPFIAIQMTCT